MTLVSYFLSHWKQIQTEKLLQRYTDDIRIRNICIELINDEVGCNNILARDQILYLDKSDIHGALISWFG